MLIDWLLYPIVLAAASAGHGLLVRRVTGAPSRLLVLPVGFAAMVLWADGAMKVASLHAVAWLAIVGPAVVGWAVWAPRGLTRLLARRRRVTPGLVVPAGTAFAAFATFAAPVVLSGQETWTGYSTIVDIGHHFDLTGWLIAHGSTIPAATSSATQVASGLLGSSYPIGFNSLLAASSELLGRDLAWIYQPTVAFAAPMAALAAYALLCRFGLPTALRALAAFVVVQPTLLYAYGLGAGFKELFSYTFVLTAAAAMADSGRNGLRRLATAAVPMLAALAVFNLTIGPWLAVLVGAFVLGGALRVVLRYGWPPSPRRLTLYGWAVVVISVVAAVALAVHFRGGVTVPSLVESQGDLGNLSAPLDEWITAGVWLTGDYRLPLTQNVGLTHVLIGCVLVLAVIGVIELLRRREEIGLGLAAAVAGTLLFLVPKTGPWIDAKAFAVNGGLVLVLAFCGVAALRRAGPVIAWAAAIVVAGSVLYGNALAYHNTTLAPAARMHELQAIGERFAGQGPTLAPSFDEYAEYFLRNMQTSGRVNPLASNFPGGSLFGTDIDQLPNGFVQGFHMLVLRRGADRTRPPSNYVRVYHGRFYDVWRRQGDPAAIKLHVALPTDPAARNAKYCRGLVQDIRKAKGGRRLLWATSPTPQPVYSVNLPHSAQWPGDFGRQGLDTLGAGRADGDPVIWRTGTYTLWATGSFERPTRFLMDGRLVGTVARQTDYPGEQVVVGRIHLTAGQHHISIVRGGGSLAPGNGDQAGNRYVSALYFQLPQDLGGKIVQGSIAGASTMCRSGRPLSWVEVVGRASVA